MEKELLKNCKDCGGVPTDEQILKTMHLGWDLMFSQARMLSMLPLEDWLESMNLADSIGPILDPTLWIKGHNKEGHPGFELRSKQFGNQAGIIATHPNYWIPEDGTICE